MSCKACGKSVTVAKERRVLQGGVYNALMEVVGQDEEYYARLHCVLSTGDTYICTKCHSVLNKYRNIMDELATIRRHVKGAMPNLAGTTTRPISPGGGPSPKRMRLDTQTTTVPRQLFPNIPVPENSPHVTVVVSKKEQKLRYFHLSRSLKQLGKYVGRGKRQMIAKAVVENATLQQEVVSQITRASRREIMKICSDSHDSILRMKSKVALEHFSWETVWLELKHNAPLLVNLFLQLVPKHKRDDNSTIMALCVCMSILLQVQSQKINLVQAVISLLLRYGHATKQVFTRLKKLHLCISYSTLLVVLDEAAEGHDESVDDWKDTLAQSIPPPDTLVSEGHNEISLHCSSPTTPVNLTLSSISISSTEVASSPQAPPFSPITPQTSSSPENDTSLVLTSPHASVNLQDENSITPCPPIASSTPLSKTSDWTGFKIVIDNIDMNLRPRHQTFHRQTQSIHYVNAYAVRDRIDFSGLTETLPAELSIEELLPSECDRTMMMTNFVILAGRMLWESIPAMQSIPNITTDHIRHPYYKEMSSKSQTVPLGILMKNENKMDDMVDILTHMHRYVPLHAVSKTVEVPGTEGSDRVQVERLHQILIGGDQLTAERVKGAQSLRRNSTHATGRLQGFVPVSEDWHAKVCFLEVIWKRLVGKGHSYTELGTLSQLKALINRTNVPMTPKKNVNASEDYLQIVVKGYIVAAAMNAFNMKDLNEALPSHIVCDLTQSSREKCQHHYNRIVHNILGGLVKLPNNPGSTEFCDDQPDGVFYYTQEVITYGLLLAEFEDAIKEGDGQRVIRCWRFFLLIFKASGRTKYALEAATLLIYLRILPSRISEQIIWSRFINVSGKAGHNKPCDLHMEHMNRTAKEALGPQACLNPKAVTRVGNCIALFQNVCRQFDVVSEAHHSSGKHVRASDTTDLQKIVHQLLLANVFQRIRNRRHTGFENFNGKTLVDKIKGEKFKEWLISHVHKLQVGYTHMFNN